MMTGQDGVVDEREREKMKGFSLKKGKKSKILYTGTGNWRHYIEAR